jgi:transcriptional regulator with XRE-family HTH domain
MDTIGTRIREARKRAGFQSAGALATALGVAKTQVYRWERGEFTPGAQRLAEIASAVKVSLEWLVTGRGPRKRRAA